MKKSLLLFALLFWIGVQTINAQAKVNGRIVDEKGEGIPGATVKVKGQSTATMTDADGNFTLDVPDGTTLVVSSVGFDEQTVTAGENIAVKLHQNSEVLHEVEISTPYGPPTTKEKYTGAADVITSKQIEKMPVSDITKAIEGAAPGVQVTSGSGQPGSGAGINIRGIGSISGGTAPLVVVDGAPYDGDITSINPMDVENITVLKDAASTSLYGSRGSNGVLVVTTKRGRRGERAHISVDAKAGTVTRGLPAYDVMTSAADYYEASWQGLYNSLVNTATGGKFLKVNPNTQQPYLTQAIRNSAGSAASGWSGQGIVDQLGYNAYKIPGLDQSLQNVYLLDSVHGKVNPNAQLLYNDDWRKAMQRTGLRQDYNLSVSGGSDKTDYYLSAGYLNEKGYILNTDYQRFSTRLNVNSQVADWVTVGMNLSATMGTQNAAGSGTSAANPNYAALSIAPIYPVYYRDANDNKVIDPVTGKYKYDYGDNVNDPNYSMGLRPFQPGSNSIGELLSNENKTNTKNITFAPYIEVKLQKNITFRTNLTTNYTNYSVTNWNTGLHGQFKSVQGALTLTDENVFNYTWNQVLTWKKNIATDHDLSVSVSHENYSLNDHYVSGSNTIFPGESFRDLSVAAGTPSTTSNTYDDRMESYLGVANYGYKGKYLFMASFRRDGLSRFSSDSRWGNFGSVSGAWIMSDEDFLKNVSWVNTLKLKASYGTQGNNQILNLNGTANYYPSQGLYDLSRPNGSNIAAIPLSLVNNNLTWENQKQVNIGTEFSLFNKVINGELNVYNRQTSGLYYNVPEAPSIGYPNEIKNAASMYNRGIELNLYFTPVKTQNVTWTINTNFTKFTNKITKLAGDADSAIQSVTMWKKGHSIYDFWLVHSDGVDKTNGDELYTYYDANGNKKDTNNYVYATTGGGNGRRYTGKSSIPIFSGAVTNTISYKNFTFTFLITYAVGGKYYDGTYQGLMTMGSVPGLENYSKDIKNAWSVDNQNSNLPRSEFGNVDIGQTSDRWLVSASYINIRNLGLSYAFPQSMIKKAGFGSLMAYITADNIALISARKGMNPQANFGGSANADYGYNPARTIMAGIKLGL
jgi:TonB-linked SusC/RagA family outer membrane protein